MKVLLTGASSFTGYWFARAAQPGGMPRRRAAARRRRGLHRRSARRTCPASPFGRRNRRSGAVRFGPLYASVAKASGFRPYFAITPPASAIIAARISTLPGAVAENTANLRAVLAAHGAWRAQGRRADRQRVRAGRGRGRGAARRILALWPVERSDGGDRQPPLPRIRHLRFNKFVIPNPFGPLEEPRFCAYLIRVLEERRNSTREHSKLRARQYPCLAARGGVR